MKNKRQKRRAGSLQARITFMFLLVSICIGMVIFAFWTKVMEPRLRAEAKSNAATISYSQTQLLADSLHFDGSEIDLQRVNGTIDRILLLTESNTDQTVVLGLELELDPDQIVVSENDLKTQYGETQCESCFITENPLYSSINYELIGVARFYSSDVFFQRLKQDVKNYFILGSGLLVALLLISWYIVAILLKPLSSLASSLRDWDSKESDHIPKLRGVVSEEIVLIKVALDGLLSETHNQLLTITNAHEYTDSIISSMQEALFVVNQNMTIRSVNQYSSKMLGYKDIELTGKSFSEIIRTSEDTASESLFMEQEFTGSEVLLLSKTGELVPVIFSRSFLQGNGDKASGSVFIATNITQRKQAEVAIVKLNEELEQRVEERTAELRAAQQNALRKERLIAVGQLTATVSHELRNPLGTIRTSLYSLINKIPDTDVKVRTIIARIERNVDRCNNIISELLDYSRVKELNLTINAVEPWLQKVVAEYEVPASVELQCKLQSTADIEIDSDRFRRVIINILDNAVQAIAQHIELTGKNQDQTVILKVQTFNEWVIISCIDSGPGITEETMKKIFEPLFSTKSFGVGLGLPLVKNIMHQHGGDIIISHHEGKGAQVDLKLPRIKSNERGGDE